MQQVSLKRNIRFLAFLFGAVLAACGLGDALTVAVRDVGVAISGSSISTDTGRNSISGGNTCTLRFVAI